MKIVFLISLCTQFLFTQSISQNISIANERMNIFYIGVDNPISIAAEGIALKNLIIKSTNGEVTKDFSGIYLFRPKSVGPSEIILYSKVNGKLKEFGRSHFRSKHLPLPTFRIGSNKNVMSKSEMAAQEYVRADLENFDFDIKFTVDSFKVCIFSSDTCKYSITRNFGNKLNEEIKFQFKQLKDSDVVVFKDIFIKQPDGSSTLIEPLIITIRN